MNRIQMAKYRRDNIGFIFQTYNLLPVYSVYENVSYSENICKETIKILTLGEIRSLEMENLHL